jgi:hypothetical protein
VIGYLERRRTHDAPPIPLRLVIACIIGFVFGFLTYRFLILRGPGIQGSDFTYPWLAARALIRGQEPYAAVRAATTPWTPTLFYPATAGIVVFPLAWMPVQVAAAAFVGVGSGLLAFAVTRLGYWRLWIFATPPMYRICLSPQWAPLLMAAALWTPALGIVVAKPNLALPLLAFQSGIRAVRNAIIGGGLLVVVSLALQPTWPVHWISTLRSTPIVGQYQLPITTVWGSCAVLALLRWRRPEARLFLGMACTPQNFFFYDQLPLFLVPASRLETITMAVVAWIAFFIPDVIEFRTHGLADRSARFLPLVIVGLYLPALVLILRRPNVGRTLPWIERVVKRWPRWISGTASWERPAANAPQPGRDSTVN